MNFRARLVQVLFRIGTPIPMITEAADTLIAELEMRISTAVRDYADSERAAMVSSDSYLQRFGCTAYEAMQHLVADAENIAQYALSERKIGGEK